MTAPVSSPNNGHASPPHAFGALARHRGWAIVIALITLLLGIAGIAVLLAMTLFDVWYAGELLLAAAIAQAVLILLGRGWRGTPWLALISLLYGVAGIAILVDPLLASDYTIYGIAGVLFGCGLARIAIARQHRGGHHWGWLIAAGIVAVLMAVILLGGGPFAGPFGVALFLSLDLVLQGASGLAIARAARDRGRGANA